MMSNQLFLYVFSFLILLFPAFSTSFFRFSHFPTTVPAGGRAVRHDHRRRQAAAAAGHTLFIKHTNTKLTLDLICC